jgi:hypothetical protein
LAQFTEWQRSLDCSARLAEVDVHLSDGLVTHNDHAMAKF